MKFRPGDIIAYSKFNNHDYIYISQIEKKYYKYYYLDNHIMNSLEFHKDIWFFDRNCVLITDAFRKEENEV